MFDFTLTAEDMAAIEALDGGESLFFSHYDPKTVEWFMSILLKSLAEGSNKNRLSETERYVYNVCRREKRREIPMLHEKINLGNSGYGTRDTILTTYVQNNLEGVPARRRPAVIICPGGGYEYQSDRESEPIALEFFEKEGIRHLFWNMQSWKRMKRKVFFHIRRWILRKRLHM